MDFTVISSTAASQHGKVEHSETVDCISRRLCSPHGVFLSSTLNICGIRALTLESDDSAFPLVSRLESAFKPFPPNFYKNIKYLMGAKTMLKKNSLLPVLVFCTPLKVKSYCILLIGFAFLLVANSSTGNV